MADERRWKKEDRGHRADLLKTNSSDSGWRFRPDEPVELEGRDVKGLFTNNIYILFGSRF
jgi:hypothetical protein